MEFTKLGKRLIRFALPVVALFLTWCFLYVLLAVFAPEFLSLQVTQDITVGLIFGWLQFVSTFVITIGYVRFANRHLDPISHQIREQIEASAR